ncbi:MAG: hypothetical protein BWZ09_00517 [Alphaproteobacteria bacterium ADurb.BinA305]|nr:MAG: hypothetical protein BWZ09_00517 [Alphaproteobacteria bacterium ADurb.BinA305]
MKGSDSASIWFSRLSRPSLRAVWPQFATCSMIVSKAGAGGTKTQRAMRMPCMKTRSGLCSMTAPSVPPITIMNAVGWNSEDR